MQPTGDADTSRLSLPSFGPYKLLQELTNPRFLEMLEEERSKRQQSQGAEPSQDCSPQTSPGWAGETPLNLTCSTTMSGSQLLSSLSGNRGF